MNNYDVVIMGGGIVGLSCAYYLTRKNKRVALVEKKQIGSGASGACDDMIFLQSKKPGINLELAMESLELYRGLAKDLSVDIGFESRGGMILIDKLEYVSFMEDYVSQQQRHGLDINLIDRKEAKKYHPYLKDGIIAATHGKQDSQVNPLYVMRAFLSESIRRGMDVFKGTEVVDYNNKEGHWELTLTDGTILSTENVVNATGAWAGITGKMVDIEIPITSKKGQIVVTENVPKLGEENIWSADYIISKLNPDLAKMSERHKELGIGLSFTQTSDGNYFIGSTREKGIFDKSTDSEVINILVNQIKDFFPILQNIHIIRTFAGLRPACEDGKPIISEVEGRKGYYIASGHEGDGIAMAPITGKLLAQLICKEDTAMDISELSFKRFS